MISIDLVVGAVSVVSIVGLVARHRVRAARPKEPGEVSLDSKCPACGHHGCDIEAVFVVKEQKPNTALMIQRKCKTCKADCYVPPIVPEDKWIGKEILVAAQGALPQTSLDKPAKL